MTRLLNLDQCLTKAIQSLIEPSGVGQWSLQMSTAVRLSLTFLLYLSFDTAPFQQRTNPLR